jgi:hypothetical protein
MEPVCLELHIFNDGRCVLAVPADIKQEQVDRIRALWSDWLNSAEAQPLLVLDGVMVRHELELVGEELRLVREE